MNTAHNPNSKMLSVLRCIAFFLSCVLLSANIYAFKCFYFDPLTLEEEAEFYSGGPKFLLLDAAALIILLKAFDALEEFENPQPFMEVQHDDPTAEFIAKALAIPIVNVRRQEAVCNLLLSLFATIVIALMVPGLILLMRKGFIRYDDIEVLFIYMFLPFWTLLGFSLVMNIICFVNLMLTFCS